MFPIAIVAFEQYLTFRLDLLFWIAFSIGLNSKHIVLRVKNWSWWQSHFACLLGGVRMCYSRCPLFFHTDIISYIHLYTYIHAYMHACIQAGRQTDRQTDGWMDRWMDSLIDTDIHKSHYDILWPSFCVFLVLNANATLSFWPWCCWMLCWRPNSRCARSARTWQPGRLWIFPGLWHTYMA